ncbi:MAG: hypothetical protein HOU81_26215 [Hamadaea sp.]|uniref:hypothetical protein n=1 Tax=Hamadaea sp. TaxID=2024425 RepID=UPI00184FFA7B|nr:hypothetical protein [Hamadaea sp.]NUR74320.1 hypothetical protein [Hamadaea sp.]NUT22312.1 hypothetical protein [Hamadaea sp.]
MRTHRRLITVAVAGALAALALAGCRSAPTAAAYVGDERLTEAQVTDMVDSTGGKISREGVVLSFVLSEACKQFAADKGFQPNTQQGAQALASEGLDQSTEIGRIRLEMHSCIYGAPDAGTKVSDADLHWFYEDAIRVGALSPDVTFEQVKPEIVGSQEIVQTLALRRMWADATTKQDISVSPRYRSLSISVGSPKNVPVVLQLGDSANDSVVDAPTPAPTQPAAGGAGAVQS